MSSATVTAPRLSRRRAPLAREQLPLALDAPAVAGEAAVAADDAVAGEGDRDRVAGAGAGDGAAGARGADSRRHLGVAAGLAPRDRLQEGPHTVPECRGADVHWQIAVRAACLDVAPECLHPGGERRRRGVAHGAQLGRRVLAAEAGEQLALAAAGLTQREGPGGGG